MWTSSAQIAVLPFEYNCCGVYYGSFFFFNVCHPEVFNTYINIQRCISQTQQNFIMFIIVIGRRVSILIESSSGPYKNTDPDCIIVT